MNLTELYAKADYQDEMGMLFHGDCMNLLKEIDDNCVDLCLTDPPYGMSFQSHRRKEVYDKIKNDNNLDFLDDYFAECSRIMKQNTAIYCFCSWHNIDIFKQTFEKYFKLKNIIVWVKNNHGSGDLQAGYAPKYELILYGNKGRRKFENGRKEDVWFYNKTKNENHPTEKPIDLLSEAIINSSKENEVVFDGFMGSGSTCLACKELNRRFIGCELDDKYFEVAKSRFY